MKKFLLILLLSGITFSGCATAPEIPNPFVVEETPVYHPPWPDSYPVCFIVWDVDKQARVSTDFNSNITAEQCSANMKTYLKEVIKLGCSYREELQEAICKENNDR